MEQPIHSDPELYDALPNVFKDLAEYIPVADLLKLSEAYGGTLIAISPRNLPDLEKRLGQDLAARLVHTARGEAIEVPLCQGLRRLLRCRQAWAMKAQGRATREIARELQTTRATVARMLKQERERRQRQGTPPHTHQPHLEHC